MNIHLAASSLPDPSMSSLGFMECSPSSGTPGMLLVVKDEHAAKSLSEKFESEWCVIRRDIGEKSTLGTSLPVSDCDMPIEKAGARVLGGDGAELGSEFGRVDEVEANRGG